EQVLEIHDLRTAALECDYVGAEGRLQRRVSVQLVEYDIRHCVALELDDDAITLAVGFVAQGGDAVDFFIPPQLANSLDHRRLVHLVGNLADDDRLALAAQSFDFHLAAHDDRATAESVRGADTRMTENDAASRKVGTWNDADQFLDTQPRILDERDAGIDHLAEVVRRNVRRHSNRDAACAVYQKVRK